MDQNGATRPLRGGGREAGLPTARARAPADASGERERPTAAAPPISPDRHACTIYLLLPPHSPPTVSRAVVLQPTWRAEACIWEEEGGREGGRGRGETGAGRGRAGPGDAWPDRRPRERGSRPRAPGARGRQHPSDPGRGLDHEWAMHHGPCIPRWTWLVGARWASRCSSSLSGRERKNETRRWGGRCSLALIAFIFRSRVRRPPFSAATTPAAMPRQAPSGPAPVARRGAADRADPPPSASAGTATARAGGGAEVVFASADARQGTPKKAKLAAMQGRTIYRRRDGSVRGKNVSVGEGRLPRGGGEGRAHCLGKVDSGRGGWEWCSPFVRLTRNPRT